MICEGAHPSYSGLNHCAYNAAVALAETHVWLSSRVSSDPAKWLWGDLHTNEYENVPWSMTPLKFLFHKSIAAGGNDNTINVSKLSARKNRDSTVIHSFASANFKMLVQLAKDPADDVSLFSLDTGVNGNLF